MIRKSINDSQFIIYDNYYIYTSFFFILASIIDEISMIRKNINDRQFIVYKFFSVSFFFLFSSQVSSIFVIHFCEQISIFVHTRKSPRNIGDRVDSIDIWL